MVKPPHWRKIEFPAPRKPDLFTPDLKHWTADIQIRMSNELEPRFLFFDLETREKYLNLRKIIEAIADNQCYWEGLEPNILYGEFNFDNDQTKVSHYVVAFEDKTIGENVYNIVEQHYPQKHRPYMGYKYIPDEQFVREAKKYPAPYPPIGFSKLFHTRYDREMRAVYNIAPGFSTPVPDIKVIQRKLQIVMKMMSKRYVVDMLHKFDCSSILDIEGENLYHLDAAADWEMKRYFEANPDSKYKDL